MKKDWCFKIIAVALPVVFVLLLEGVLRVVGFGNDLSLFVQDKKQPYLQHLNPKVSLRYFLREKNATTGNIERFLQNKPKGMIRIFVQGESTAVGFPYFHNGAFPRMLEYQLRKDLPELNLELVNVSMTALNSYALRDFADEIIAQRPDVIIINAGHNEYYGALGVGSSGTFGSQVMIGRLGIALRKTKIGQLISKSLSLLPLDADKTDYDQTLMKRMVRKQEIPLGSDVYTAGLRQYEQNLDETLSKYQKAGIRVFLTNTVCNLKDQKPFVSIQGPDSMQAISLFERADNYYKAGDLSHAKEEYIKAKELDALRFRAPEKINEITISLAGKYDNVVYVDVRKALEEEAPGTILGKELMLEHLHPNLKGHYLIARALVNGFKRSAFLYPNNQAETDAIMPFEELPLTAVDSLCGAYSTLLLKEGWPFNEPMAPDEPAEKSLEEVVAGGLAVRTIKWEAGLMKLMDDYIRRKDFTKAVKIGEGFILEYPYEYTFYEQTVNLCLDAGEYDKGIRYATRAFKLKKELSMTRQLVILYLKKDRPDLAIPYLDALIAAGGNIDFRPMKAIVEEIIGKKEELRKKPGDRALRHGLFSLYAQIGNMEVAAKYEVE